MPFIWQSMGDWMTDQFLTVGRSLHRKDAWEKISGKALYTADIPVENVKIGLIVRSPYHYAKILEIDKKRSLDVPGVLAVLTSDDIPGAKEFGPLIPDQPSLAIGVVRHLGEPVVLIIAETKKAAEEAKKKAEEETKNKAEKKAGKKTEGKDNKE